MKTAKKARVLVIDIETRPAVAYVWRLHDERIGTEQLIDQGGTICFGAKWLGEKGDMFYSDWKDGHEKMIRAAHALISEADAVITYNGDRFDLPKLMGEFIKLGLTAPPPWTSIDVIKTVRRMGLISTRLAFVGPLLNVGEKVKNEGFSLWVKVIKGDKAAHKQMQVYCMQDVHLLEKVYTRLRPFIRNHPHLGSMSTESCGACGKNTVQRRGFRRTRQFRIQRLQCQSCGAWSDGTKVKATTE